MDLTTLLTNYPALEGISDVLIQVKEACIAMYQAGGRLFIGGNGGTWADAAHIVGELTKSFIVDRTPASFGSHQSELVKLPEELRFHLQGGLFAYALGSQMAFFTAFSNDVNTHYAYAQELWAMGSEGDMLWCLTTSGKSQNLLYAAQVAQAKKMKVISFMGEKEAPLDALSDLNIHVPATETYRAQEFFIPIYHWLCHEMEKAFWQKG